MGEYSGECFALVAHEGAARSIADFWPKWKAFGLPIAAFIPEEDQWPGSEQPDWLFRFGKSAHRGPDAFRRVAHVFRTLQEMGCSRSYVLEPDCVPMRTELQEPFEDAVSGWICTVEEKELFPYAILPPWSANREDIARLADAASKTCDSNHPDCLDLTDRWLAKTCAEHKIKMRMSRNVFGYVWRSHIRHTVRALNPAWCHGWKSQKEMEAALAG